MITIQFVPADNAASSSIQCKTGQSLMQAAVAANVDGIEAECGGVLTCSTCHVYVREPHAGQLPPPSADELGMLEFTASPRKRNSRLSCQIRADRGAGWPHGRLARKPTLESHAMILEIAEIRITHPTPQPPSTRPFSETLTTVAAKAKGMRGYKVNKCIESPERYVLQIFWDTLEDHTVGFRQGPTLRAMARHHRAIQGQPAGGGALRTAWENPPE